MPPFEHSVEADVGPEFAWNYWTDIRNWADPPAQFILDGPFSAGAKGTTLIPGQEPTHWVIEAVDSGKSAKISLPLDRAVFSFEWRFEGLSDCLTKITRRIGVIGENAEAYEAAQSAFSENLPAGMKRIAAAMAQAESSGKVNPP
jgi:hypothetical protein